MDEYQRMREIAKLKQMYKDFDMGQYQKRQWTATDNPLWDALGFAYGVFKFSIIAALFVGLGITSSCNNQVWEICKMIGLCD